MSKSLAALYFALLLLAPGVSWGEGDAHRPSILLVTFDTTRADRIGIYGYEAARTPTLDRLATEGVRFDTAVAPTPVTLPSHASILTGVYPTAHGVRDNGAFVLGQEATLLSEVLRDRGWRTGAFVGTYVLDRKYGLDQGFETYRGPSSTDLGAAGDAEHPANEVVDDAVAWLDSLDPKEAFFAWVHFYDPHAPYDPPEPWKSRSADPYDAEIAYCDAQLARLLSFLDRKGFVGSEGTGRGLLTVVTADHGESFGEHGEKTHGMFVYGSTVHVPLIFAGPGVGPRGHRVASPVSTADVAPTLLALAGVPQDAMPKSRLPALFAAGRPVADPERAVYAETLVPYFTMRWHAQRSMRTAETRLVEGKHTELYALAEDPGEQTNLAAEQPDRVVRLRKQLRELAAAHAGLGWAEETELDAGERRLLESLGYVTGDTSGNPFDPTLPDPAQHIVELDWIGESGFLIEEAQELRARPVTTAWQRGENEKQARVALEEARGKLERALERSPDNLSAKAMIGTVTKQLGDHAAAIRYLEQFLAARSLNSVHRYRLGTSYFATERPDDAVREMHRIVDTDPHFAPAYEWLFRYHESRQEFGHAVGWLTAMLEAAEDRSPRRPELSNRLAALDAEREQRGQRVITPDTHR